jgi:hypothetical protein
MAGRKVQLDQVSKDFWAPWEAATENIGLLKSDSHRRTMWSRRLDVLISRTRRIAPTVAELGHRKIVKHARQSSQLSILSGNRCP